MRYVNLRGLMGSLGIILALGGSSVPLQAGFTPTQAGTLMSETVSFVEDFGAWNQNHGDLPLALWLNTPAGDQAEAFCLLFWLWLCDQKGQAAADQFLCLLLWNSWADGGIAPGLLGPWWLEHLCLAAHEGKEPPSLAGNGGPNSPSLGGSSPQSPGPNGPSGGSPGGTPDPPPVNSVPGPSAFTLLAIGGSGAVLGWWIWQRGLLRLCRGSFRGPRRLAQAAD